MNYGESGARKRKWNNTEHCHEAKLTWAIGKEAFKNTTTQMTTNLAFPSLKFARQDAAQTCKKSYMIRWSQENSNVSVCSVKLQNSKHSGKNVVDSLIGQKEFFSSVFTTFASSFCLTEDSILAEVNCQLNLLLRSLWKLWRCLGVVSLCSKGILFKAFVIWSHHAVRHFTIYELRLTSL